MGGMVCRLLRSLNTGRASPQGILIYAPPGEGKTTLLRAVAAGLAGADGGTPLRTVVVDTRGELGFETDGRGLCLDILRGYPRARGVEIATRTLSVQVIICDEIGDTDEALSLISIHHGGVPLVATAHGGSVAELLRRTGLRLLHEARLFGAYVGIRRDGRGGFTYRVVPWEQAENNPHDSERLCGALPAGVTP
jgi:stage III sporulation protein AA